MLLIAAATDMEMQAFTRSCEGSADFEFLVTGVGPVETTFTLTSRLARGLDTVQGIIHFGIAGAYLRSDDGGAGMLDICLAEEEILGDFGICHQDRIEPFVAPELGVSDRFLLDKKLLEKTALFLEQEHIPCRTGRFVTVSCASGTRSRGNMLAEQFQGLCENMEGAAVARVCTGFNLPCLELRCISNFVEDRNTGRWKLKEACARAGTIAARVAGHLRNYEVLSTQNSELRTQNSELKTQNSERKTVNPEPEKLSIGYSPCPNDTFIFYALMHGHIPLSRVAFKEPVLADVEQLNRWAMEAKLDVTKLSFHALGYKLDEYVMLSAGAALGRGCGPLLVAGQKGFRPSSRSRIAIPGTHTTAALLLRLYAPEVSQTVVLRFDRIMEAVQNGEVDGGVIIHEGRFTYQEKGLHCVRDLGNWWEEETGYPIPLGCIAARASLDRSLLQEIDQGIRASLGWIRQHPEQGMDYIRAHAQELDRRVIGSHIDLYVNDFSEELGDEGIQAVQELLRRGRESGIFPMEGQLQWIR